MLAARIHQYGSADVFRVEEAPDPRVGPDDVLIDAHATSVNPVDYKIRQGSQRGIIHLSLPHPLGMDVSGTVLAVGDRVRSFKVGDEVYASPSHRRMGTYATRVAVRASEVAPKPASLSHIEAASLPLVALTAYDALVTACKLSAGQRVLIQAGSGGVGTAAIQIAKHLGAEVLTTCSTRNVELVRSLGADRVIDYTKEDYRDVAQGVDAVLESLGGEHVMAAAKLVRRGGHVAMITTGLPEMAERFGPRFAPVPLGLKLAWQVLSARIRHGAKLHVVARKPVGDHLRWLNQLIENGELKPVIDNVFPLKEIAEAHRTIETGRVRGKVVIDIKA